MCAYLRGKGMLLCSDSNASVSGHKSSALLCRERAHLQAVKNPKVMQAPLNAVLDSTLPSLFQSLQCE